MYCSKCGSEISSTTAFCSTCGQAISSFVPALPSLSPVVPSPPAPVVPAGASYGGVEYAGFWLRFVAYLIDGLVSCAAFLVLLVPLFILTGAGAALSKIGSGEDISDNVAAFMGIGFIFGFFGIILVVSWLYYALLRVLPGRPRWVKILNLSYRHKRQPISFAGLGTLLEIITGAFP